MSGDSKKDLFVHPHMQTLGQVAARGSCILVRAYICRPHLRNSMFLPVLLLHRYNTNHASPFPQKLLREEGEKTPMYHTCVSHNWGGRKTSRPSLLPKGVFFLFRQKRALFASQCQTVREGMEDGTEPQLSKNWTTLPRTTEGETEFGAGFAKHKKTTSFLRNINACICFPP